MHVHETGCQSGVRWCSMPGLPRHLVQELNVGTVALALTRGVERGFRDEQVRNKVRNKFETKSKILK